MRTPNFATDSNKYGKFGEEAFRKLFNERKYGDFLQDVTKDIAWRNLDVDFIIHKRNGAKQITIPIEVKVDTAIKRTGNIALEIVSHGTPGWFVKTKATHVFIFSCTEDKELKVENAYCLNMKFRNMYDHPEYIKHAKGNYIKEENITDLLFPIKYLKEEGFLKQVI